jgi:hypothetical protein
VGVADPGILCHHPKLTLQRERQANADREAIYRCDQRLLQIGVARLTTTAPVKQRIVRILVRRALARGLVARKELDVAAGTERVAGAADDATIDVRVQSDITPDARSSAYA